MSVFLSPVGGAGAQFFDNNGDPLSGGKLYTYAAGTTTPQVTYTSSSGSTPNSNPIVLDAAGRVPGSSEIWLTSGVAYKFVLKTSNDVLLATWDNISGFGDPSFAEYTPAASSLLAPGPLTVKTALDDITDESSGSSVIGYTQGGVNSVDRTVQSKLREVISIKDFGADPGASASVNTAAIQAAINAAPQGGAVLIPNGTFQINDALVIDKALTIYGEGPGKFMETLGGSIIKQINTAKNAFTLRASLAQWAFGQYGLNNVNFENFAIEGTSGYPAAKNYAARGIGCDTTVNGGDYHIRECTFTNLQVRFFSTGIELVGICYLNDFYGGVISWCDTGFALYRGLASDRGGQTRFFGTTIDLITDACLRWNTDTDSGDLSLFGCTLADAQYGLISNEQATLMVSGCSFENLKKTGNLGAGVYIEIKEANPASDAAKVFIGNKMLLSDVDIWLDCTNAATIPGAFNWPMLIEGNTLLSPEALRISMPVGAFPMSSSQFVLGASNAGANNGQLAPSQISTNFAGFNALQRSVVRRVTFGPSAAGAVQLPLGMVVTSARMYLTANASSFTSLFGGDADNNNRYYSGINGQTAPLNTWTNWTPPVPQFIVNTTSKQQVVLSGTAGLLGAAGVFEIEGYIP